MSASSQKSCVGEDDVKHPGKVAEAWSRRFSAAKRFWLLDSRRLIGRSDSVEAPGQQIEPFSLGSPKFYTEQKIKVTQVVHDALIPLTFHFYTPSPFSELLIYFCALNNHYISRIVSVRRGWLKRSL